MSQLQFIWLLQNSKSYIFAVSIKLGNIGIPLPGSGMPILFYSKVVNFIVDLYFISGNLQNRQHKNSFFICEAVRRPAETEASECNTQLLVLDGAILSRTGSHGI